MAWGTWQHVGVTTTNEDITGRPWGARRPQNFLVSALFIGLAVALVWQAFAYIGEGVGGVVPFLLIPAGPGIAIYYIWYFNFRDFESEASSSP